MTLKAFQNQARQIQAARNQTCLRVRIGGGWTLLLDFGHLKDPDERGYREARYSIVSECPWRIEDRRRVITGSGDCTEAMNRGVRILVDKTLREIDVIKPSYTATLHFEGHLTLWMFPDDPRDYAGESDDPRVPWYITGYAIPGDWEDE